MTEQKIVLVLSQLAVCFIPIQHNNETKANPSRNRIGLKHPPIDGIDVLENHNSINLTVRTTYMDTIDLAIAHEIIQVCCMFLCDFLCRVES